jgi:catechol 2,3-dioxygenase-like lactoylglutathione lyase family enzyme
MENPTAKLPTPATVVALRPFLPATDFETSLRFYTELGFRARRMGDGFAEMAHGPEDAPFTFLMQAFSAPGYADNYMMHMTVTDLDAWWAYIHSLDLAIRYGVRAPSEPKLQPWGLVVSYIVDPSGILWHIAQSRR